MNPGQFRKSLVLTALFTLASGLAVVSSQPREPAVSVWNTLQPTRQSGKVVVEVLANKGDVVPPGTIRLERALEPLRAFEWFRRDDTQTRDYEKRTREFFAGLKTRPVGERTFVPDKPDRFGNYRITVDFGPLPAGLYVVRAGLNGIADTAWNWGWLLVSDLGMVVKRWPGATLVYTGSTTDGRPLASEVWSRATPRQPARSDVQGLTRLASSERYDLGGSENTDLIVARSGDHWAVSESEVSFQGARGVVVTDRPVYRPGDTVHWKVVLHDRNTFKPLEGRSVFVAGVEEPKDWKVGFVTDEFGTVSGQFKLPKEARIGTGIISASVEASEYACAERRCLIGGAGAQYRVEAYRKPDVQVSVTTDRARVVQGEPFKARVRVTGLFDGARSGMRVTWIVSRARASAYRALEQKDADWRTWKNPAEVFQRAAPLDANGEASLEVPTARDPDDKSAVYNVAARLEDVSDDVRSTGANVVAHPSGVDVAVGAQGNTYPHAFFPGQPVRVWVRSRDFDEVPRPTRVRVELVKLPDRDGASLESGATLEAREVVTDANGEAEITFADLALGRYGLLARWTDDQGRASSNRAQDYLSGFIVRERTEEDDEPDDEPTWAQAGPQLNASLDRKEYRVGENATLTVRLPDGAKTAFLTLETDRVVRAAVIRAAGSSLTWRIPVTPELRRNAFVNVVSMASGFVGWVGQELRVSPEDLRLNVSLTMDKAVYAPGERGRLEVRVRNPLGRGVPAEVCVGVVDEGVYLVRNDDTDTLSRLYRPRRRSQVFGSTSQKAWEEQALADAVGQGDDLPDPAPRPAQPVAFDSDEGRARQDLRDTMLFEPRVLTDADGRATLEVPFADNLTTWRITARAFTKRGQAGDGRTSVRTAQDVVARIVKPRFLVRGDEARLGAVVSSALPEGVSGEFALLAPGLGVSSSSAVTVGANGFASLSADARALTVGATDVTASFRSGRASDALRLPLEVLPRRSSDVFLASSDAQDGPLEFRLRDGAIRDGARLSLQVIPSLQSLVAVRLLPTNRDWRAGLTQNDHACAYGAIRLFRAASLVREMFPADRLPVVARAAIPEMLEYGLERLGALQRADGSWDWCSNPDPERRMPAVAEIVSGLARARRGGVAVEPRAMDRAVAWLKANVKDGSRPAMDRSAAFLALAEAGAPDAEGMVALSRVAPTEALVLANLALAFLEIGRDDQARALFEAVKERRLELEQSAFWTIDAPNPYLRVYDWREQDVTAAVLELYARLEPRSPVVAKIVRWFSLPFGDANPLVFARAAIALERTRPARSALEPQVLLNGTVISRVGSWIEPEGFSKDDFVSFAPLAGPQLETLLRPDGANRLEVQPASAFFSAQLEYNLEPERFEAVSKGIRLTRRYEKLERVQTAQGFVYRPRALRREAGAPKPLELEPLEVGDLVLVTLTPEVIRGQPRNGPSVEDPMPAGFQALDEQALPIEGLERPDPSQPGANIPYREFRDERVRFRSLSYGEPGQRLVFRYTLRARTPGRFVALPARLSDDTQPEYRASTPEDVLVIQQRQ